MARAQVAGGYPSTRGSVVEALCAGDSAQRNRALGTVVELYSKPLAAYLRGRFGCSPEDAEDLIQGFFTTALERSSLSKFDPRQASFRTFLRLLVDHHVSNHFTSMSRLKRGGDVSVLDPAEAEDALARVATADPDPEALLQREWRRSVFTMAVARLERDLQRDGRGAQYQVFASIDLADDPKRPSYRAVAQQLQLTETTVTNHLAAARRRFRTTVLEVLREVTATEAEFRAEARAALGFDG